MFGSLNIIIAFKILRRTLRQRAAYTAKKGPVIVSKFSFAKENYAVGKDERVLVRQTGTEKRPRPLTPGISEAYRLTS